MTHGMTPCSSMPSLLPAAAAISSGAAAGRGPSRSPAATGSPARPLIRLRNRRGGIHSAPIPLPGAATRPSACFMPPMCRRWAPYTAKSPRFSCWMICPSPYLPCHSAPSHGRGPAAEHHLNCIRKGNPPLLQEGCRFLLTNRCASSPGSRPRRIRQDTRPTAQA